MKKLYFKKIKLKEGHTFIGHYEIDLCDKHRLKKNDSPRDKFPNIQKKIIIKN